MFDVHFAYETGTGKSTEMYLRKKVNQTGKPREGIFCTKVGLFPIKK